MRISYYEKDGRIGVKYYSPLFGANDDAEDFYPFNAELMDEFNAGLIPIKNQQAGKRAVAEFAKKLCTKDWKKRTKGVRAKLRSRKNCINNMDIPLTIEHPTGVTLRGRIVKNPDGYGILVTLEAPFKSKDSIIFDYPNCFASSMGGMHVYKDDGTLTAVALKDSRKAVAQLYEQELTRQKHGDVLDVVESLNSTTSHED